MSVDGHIRSMVNEDIAHHADSLVKALRAVARDCEMEASRIEKSGVDVLWVDGHMASNMASMIVPRIVRLAESIGKREVIDTMENLK